MARFDSVQRLGVLKSSPYSGTAIALAGLMVTGVCLALFIGFSTSPAIAIETGLIIVIGIGPLYLRVERRQGLDVFEPIVALVVLYIIVFAIRPLFLISPWSVFEHQIPGDVFPLFPTSNDARAIALLYALLGLICLHFGYGTPTRPSGRPCPPRPWLPNRARHVILAGLVASLLSAAAIAPAVTSSPGILRSFGQFRTILAGYAYSALGLSWLSVYVVILAVSHLKGHGGWWLFVPLGAVASLYYAALGNRAGVLSLWLSVYAAHTYLSRKRSLIRRTLVVPFCIVLGVGFMLSLGELRNKGASDTSDIAVVASQATATDSIGLFSAKVLLDFGDFDVFASIIHAGPEVVPFLWGQGYGALFTYVVPRSLWPDKPEFFEETIGYTLTNRLVAAAPAHMVGELYVNFNVFGISFGMFIVGRIFKKVYVSLIGRWLASGLRPDPGNVVIYVLFFPYLAVFSRSLVIGTVMCTLLVLPAWLAVRYISGFATGTGKRVRCRQPLTGALPAAFPR